MSPQRKVQAVFLDRDGVINAHPDPGKRYITRPEEFRFLPGVPKALARLSQRPYKLVVVSNQAGVGLKRFSKWKLFLITRKMRRGIRQAGGRLDAVYYCTHAPQAGCSCRKPRLGLVRRAERRFSLDLKRSFLIGDNEKDIRVGRQVGSQALLVLTGETSLSHAKRFSVRPDRIFQNLSRAADWILRQPWQKP